LKRLKPYILFLNLLVSLTAYAQYDPKKVCRLEDGKLIFTIDRTWTKNQFQEISHLFDLDSLLIDRAIKGDKEFIQNEELWKITRINNNIIELTKSHTPSTGRVSGTGDVIILDDKWIKPELLEFRESDRYGVNRFTLYSSFRYQKGVAKFFLPGNLSAEYVNIAGTFNNWSTMGTPMIKTDSGWVVNLKLKPGKYMYKYIVNGKWTTDPYNKIMERWDNNNSVVYCPNHYFYLRGYQTAKKVSVAGSFNDWNPAQLNMIRIPGGWGIMMYLHEGSHAYKFIVDGNWIPDPGNKVLRPDGNGNVNSFLILGDTVTVTFHLNGFTDKNHINLAGNFNGWDENEIIMEKTSTGWKLAYFLLPGNYEYKFIADDKWMIDPANPYTVGSGETMNSFLPVRPNYTFVLDDNPDAKNVIVTGNFNGWNGENYRMIRKDRKWIFPVYLKPGKYIYKFIIDGKWITDPANSLWEQNEYGTKNSVLWIEP
jgi:hypothetical protein